MGLDFTIVPGKGPKILKPIRSISDVENLNVILDVDRQVPFLGPILKVISANQAIALFIFFCCYGSHCEKKRKVKLPSLVLSGHPGHLQDML